MQPLSNIFIGVDVSKDELVIAYPKDGRWIKSVVSNRISAINSWLNQIDFSDKHFVLEATGPYSERLCYALAAQSLCFSIINPAQSRSMSKVLLKRNKNDDQDAQTLSILGQKLELNTYKMPSDVQKKRKEAFSALVSLQKQEQQLKNQLHAFEYRVNPNPIAVEALQSVLASTQEAIQTLQNELNPEQDEEEDLKTIKRIASIKGVGIATAKAFVTLFGDFSHFKNAKAFASFLGLAPSEFSSGTSVRGRNAITKNGNSKVRGMLFNCARSAMRFNQNCKELYERLIQNGKNGKVALTAVMHKLARIIFGVVASKTNYNPELASIKSKK